MKQGKVYWITGLAGAGKTTVGNALYCRLREIMDNVVILDGDILKQIVSSLTGYSYNERKQRARSYSNFCRILSEQGITVIICTIAMFHEIREWNRNHIENYIEVFLDVKMEILKERNKRALYTGTSNVAGIDVAAELPEHPDIIIKNDGYDTVDTIVDQIMAFEKEEEIYIDDTKYWNAYYRKERNAPKEHSGFAEAVYPYIEQGKKLLDLGCGNGRDSLFFLDRGVKVTGIDSSSEAVKKLREIGRGQFICGDFIRFRTLFQQQYDYCYSRFTLHAINERQEDELLKNVSDTLEGKGLFFIEARTIHDSIYGRGEQAGRHAYVYHGHYRRFIDVDAFREKVLSMGCFDIMELCEGTGWAKTEDSDPVLMRCILVKK